MTNEEFDKALYGIVCETWKAYRESSTAGNNKAMLDTHKRLYDDFSGKDYDLLHFLQLLSNEMMLIWLKRRG